MTHTYSPRGYEFYSSPSQNREGKEEKRKEEATVFPAGMFYLGRGAYSIFF